MADKTIPGSYIDTQGMGGPMSPEDAAKAQKVEYKPATTQPKRIITPELCKELKILVNEVLDEREGKTGISYFDTKHFKHTVIEDEPPYTPYQ